jgi:ZPR1 zinc-finger domain
MSELNQLNFDIGHQELSRIILELEEYSAQFPESFNIPMEAAYQWLCVQLGYEDNDELEDAIKGTLQEFLQRLPQFKVSSESYVFAPLPVSMKPRRLKISINTTRDLFNVLIRGPDSRIEIPEIEFEMGAPGTRQIDTIYNYIGGAIFQLGEYIKNFKPDNDTFDKLYATLLTLNSMLDVEEPFTVVVHDKCGDCAFQPMDQVEILEDTQL